MSKKPIIGGIILAAIIGVVFVGAQINPDNPEYEERAGYFHNTTIEDTISRSLMKEIWSARMVGTEVSYNPPHEGIGTTWDAPSSFVNQKERQEDHYWSSAVAVERNTPYQFDFVATGNSPETIRITIGDYTIFYEVFHKQGTLVETGISEYYTWDYVGNKNFEISAEDCSSPHSCKIIVERSRYGIFQGATYDGGTVTIFLSR